MKRFYVGYRSYFRPLSYVLNLLGIPLILHRDATTTCKYRLLRLWGLLLFAVNVGSSFGVVYVIILSTYATAAAQTVSVSSTMTWISIVMQSNMVIYKLGSHLNSLVLAGSLDQIEMVKLIRRLWFPGLKVRPLSIITLIILTVVIFIF